jgi:SNF2 family DNA or RNA helicase
MKEDVLQDLPPKIIQDYYCELSPLQVWKYLLQIFDRLLGCRRVLYPGCAPRKTIIF